MKDITQMGGLIKKFWQKRDGSTRMRRRESAPLQLSNKRKPSSEEAYRESLIRFTKFRENERVQRLSMGANDMAAYHSISGEAPNFSVGNITPTEQKQIAYEASTCPSKSYRSKQLEVEDKNGVTSQNALRTKKISVQFYLDESTDDTDYRKLRHSMPAIVSNPYARGSRRNQGSVDSTMIREKAIEEFEEAHCVHSDSLNGEEHLHEQRSPPSKFYKPNSDPFQSNGETTSLSTFYESKPMSGKCPEKPKRLLLNSKQSRKLLTEAHFTGAYRNFEIQTPSESRQTLDEHASEMNAQLRTPNRLLHFHETMQASDIICLIGEFDSMGKMEAKVEMPLYFEWGTFKRANVTVRKYTDMPINDVNKDFTLIAETAIIRDAEVLRKFRHANIINLMAIAFEPFRRLALIMEPTTCSLNHHLFVKNMQLELIEVVNVVKQIAAAVLYLQEFGISHSNISSHTILVGENVTHVKLSSFELAVPYKSDIRDEVELKSKQKSKRTPSIRSTSSPKHSLSSEQNIERYKSQTNDAIFAKSFPFSNLKIVIFLMVILIHGAFSCSVENKTARQIENNVTMRNDMLRFKLIVDRLEKVAIKMEDSIPKLLNEPKTTTETTITTTTTTRTTTTTTTTKIPMSAKDTTEDEDNSWTKNAVIIETIIFISFAILIFLIAIVIIRAVNNYNLGSQSNESRIEYRLVGDTYV